METERKFPTIQTDNLRAVLAHIEANPQTWIQSEWHCGTSHCFGGWAQIMAGNEAITRRVRIDARKWLGLTAYEATQLFAGGNSLDDLRRLVAEITDAGYDRAGYDRDGYNRDGYNRAGYDRAGYDRAGYDRDGYNRAGYDRAGYDRDAFDEDGLNADNLTMEEVRANAGGV